MGAQSYGPWSGGFNNVADENSLKPDELYLAENVDIDAQGNITRFPGTVGVQLDMAPYISSWMINGVQVTIDAGGVSGLDATLPVEDPDDERLLRALPGGSAVCGWQGRTLVARDTYILFSEPMQLGVYDPLRNFVAFPEEVIWLAPLHTGVFVGLESSVVFLEGSSPDEWAMSTVSGPSWRGCSAVMKTTFIDPQLVKNQPVVAVWFGRNGFELGLPTGEVVKPQAKKIDLPEMFEGRLIVNNDRLTVISVY
jgi:hypothetical protein